MKIYCNCPPLELEERFSTEDRLEGVTETMELVGMGPTGQTILTAAAKKQGMETLVLEQGKLPSIIQCAMKGDGGRVEVETIPRLSELSHETTQTVEIANVQDPETGATRQYIVTQMCDSTSKQNLETIVEAIRHLEGDHLFSEESGPHQVVKEEVVESCIIEDGGVVEMSLPSLIRGVACSSPLNSHFGHPHLIPHLVKMQKVENLTEKVRTE